MSHSKPRASTNKCFSACTTNGEIQQSLANAKGAAGLQRLATTASVWTIDVGMQAKDTNAIFCIEYVCNYSRERHIGQFDPDESINALGIEFIALWGHLPSGKPNHTTNSVLY